MGLSFQPLSEEEHRWITERLLTLDGFVRAFDPELGSEPLTHEVIDRAFSQFIRSEHNPNEANIAVQAVGIALGRALVEELGFHWMIATDDYGVGLAVVARPGHGDVTIFPLDFVSKRYERRESPFFVHAILEIGEQLKRIESEWQERQ